MEIETTENKDSDVEFVCTIDDNGIYNTITPTGLLEQSRAIFSFGNVVKTVHWSFITPIANNSGLYFRCANLTKAGNDVLVNKFNVCVTQV